MFNWLISELIICISICFVFPVVVVQAMKLTCNHQVAPIEDIDWARCRICGHKF